MKFNRLRQTLVFLFLGLSLAAFSFQPPAFGGSQEDCSRKHKICFEWSFIAQQNNRYKAINKSEKHVLESGDKLKASFELRKDCFLYFIHSGPRNEVSMLYPYELPQKIVPGGGSHSHHIPKDNQWLILDDQTGIETFYLIASSNRLKGLESLLAQYNSADVSAKEGLGKKIIEKINAFHRQSKKMTAAAERPVQVGGTVRSSTSKDKRMLLEECASIMVAAKDFYIKAIVIEHR